MKNSSYHFPVSVVVPLFNRESFLPQLLETLTKQTFQNFEVILVDDGSTDDSRIWITKNFGNSSLHYKYLHQKNSGPYTARNYGIKAANGKYIALFDSDDEWPDYHLAVFYDAMEKNTDIDWLFGSIERIEHGSGKLLENSNFYMANGKPHPVISLHTEQRNNAIETIYVLKDSRLAESIISHTLPGSMQCSFLRREVFDNDNFFDESFRTAYDRFFCMSAAINGFTFAYTTNRHLIYHVHDDNISTVNNAPPEKLLKSAKTMLRGYSIIKQLAKNKAQRRAATRRLSEVYAWELSIAHQRQSLYLKSIENLWSAIKLKPVNILYYKSFVAAALKYLFAR